MELELWITAVLCGVFFCTGFMDGVAGGGGLISLPALLLAGLPPEAAMGTNKVAAYCGITASMGSYARSGLVCWKAAKTGIPALCLGAVVGTKCVLSLDSELIGKLIVFLLPLGAVFTLMPKKDKGAREMTDSELRFKLPATCFGLGFYDGFYGPGSGTFCVMALHVFLGFGLLRAAATAKMLPILGGVGSMIIFALNGQIYYMLALPLSVCCMAGNVIGSRVAMRVGPDLVRRFIAFSLVVLFASLVWKFWFAD